MSNQVKYSAKLPHTADVLQFTQSTAPQFINRYYPGYTLADLVRAKIAWRMKENMLTSLFGSRRTSSSSRRRSTRRRRSSKRRSSTRRRSSRRKSRGGAKKRRSTRRKSRK